MIDTLVVDGLAAARLARLVTTDALTAPLRRRVRWAVGDGHLPEMAETFIDCSWCVTVWTAAAVMVARTCAPRAWEPVARALAVSMVAGRVLAG